MIIITKMLLMFFMETMKLPCFEQFSWYLLALSLTELSRFMGSTSAKLAPTFTRSRSTPLAKSSAVKFMGKHLWNKKDCFIHNNNSSSYCTSVSNPRAQLFARYIEKKNKSKWEERKQQSSPVSSPGHALAFSPLKPLFIRWRGGVTAVYGMFLHSGRVNESRFSLTQLPCHTP